MEQDKITLLAKSSSGDGIYQVDFIFENDRMSIHCNCPTGWFGKFCKHKMSFLKGNDYYLYTEIEDDDDQYDHLDYVSRWAQRSEYLDYIIKMRKLQKVFDEAEANLNAVKRQLAKAMKKGLKKYQKGEHYG